MENNSLSSWSDDVYQQVEDFHPVGEEPIFTTTARPMGKKDWNINATIVVIEFIFSWVIAIWFHYRRKGVIKRIEKMGVFLGTYTGNVKPAELLEPLR